MRIPFFLFLLLPICLDAVNLIENGGFELTENLAADTFWSAGPGVGHLEGATKEIVREPGNRFLRFQMPPGSSGKGQSWVSREITLSPGWKKLKFSYKLRGRLDAAPPQSWEGAIVNALWKDADGQILNSYPPKSGIHTVEVVDAWKRHRLTFEVPPGAATLVIEPGLWSATGTADFDDFTLEPSMH